MISLIMDVKLVYFFVFHTIPSSSNNRVSKYHFSKKEKHVFEFKTSNFTLLCVEEGFYQLLENLLWNVQRGRLWPMHLAQAFVELTFLFNQERFYYGDNKSLFDTFAFKTGTGCIRSKQAYCTIESTNNKPGTGHFVLFLLCLCF